MVKPRFMNPGSSHAGSERLWKGIPGAEGEESKYMITGDMHGITGHTYNDIQFDQPNLERVQWELLAENFLRDNFGRVHSRTITIKSADDECFKYARLAAICTMMGWEIKLKRDNISWSEDYVLTMRVVTEALESGTQVELEVDEVLGAEDYVEAELDSAVSFATITIVFRDLEYMSKIREAVNGAGLVVSEGVRARKLDKGKVGFFMGLPGASGVGIKNASFDYVYFDSIEKNYGDLVVEKTKALVEKIKSGDAKGGLVILNGPAGTGKTYLVRSLLTELNEERSGVVCVPATSFLRNSGMLIEAAQASERYGYSTGSYKKKPIIVLEDIGEILAADAAVHYADERANLLNITDGLLQSFLDCIVIMSFNYDLDKVDPAVLRPGRCIEQIEVGLLEKEHAERLTGLGLQKGSYSLAQVYSMKRTGEVVKPEVMRTGFVK